MACKGNYGMGWDKNTPDTFEAAKPTDWEEVVNILAIEIKNGYYRDATFSGIFEIADINKKYVGACFAFVENCRLGQPADPIDCRFYGCGAEFFGFDGNEVGFLSL